MQQLAKFFGAFFAWTFIYFLRFLRPFVKLAMSFFVIWLLSIFIADLMLFTSVGSAAITLLEGQPLLVALKMNSFDIMVMFFMTIGNVCAFLVIVAQMVWGEQKPLELNSPAKSSLDRW